MLSKYLLNIFFLKKINKFSIIIFVIIFISRIFTSALADSFSLDSELQQVSPGLQDSSRYSGLSQQYCSLNGLSSSSDFQLFQSPYQTFEDRSNRTNYKFYHYHPHVPQLSLFSSKVEVFTSLFAFFDFHFVVRRNGKIHYTVRSLFSIITKSGLLVRIRCSICISENFIHFLHKSRFRFELITFSGNVKFIGLTHIMR